MSGDVDPGVRRRFKRVFANLPWLQREIFRLHCLEHLSYAEIGWLMGLSTRSVERQMARALYKLTRQMDGHKLSWRERWF